MQHIMSVHGGHFDELPPSKKAAFEQRAATTRAQRLQQLEADIAQEQAHLSHLESLAPASEQVGSMMLSHAAWSEKTVERLEQLKQSNLYNKSGVDSLRSTASTCPKPMPQTEFQTLCELSLLPDTQSPDYGALAKRFAAARDQLQSAVIGLYSAEGWSWYRLLTVMLKPVLLVWLPLAEVEGNPVVESCRTKEDWIKNQALDYEYVWSYNADDYDSVDLFQEFELENLFIIPCSVFKAPHMLVSASSMVSLQHWLDKIAMQPQSAAAKPPVPASSSTSMRTKTTTTPPWVQSLMQMGQTAKGQKTAEAPTASASASSTTLRPSPPDPVLEPEAPEGQEHSAWEELEDARQQINTTADELDEHFKISLLGGSWQVARTGRVIYGCRADIRPRSPLQDYVRAFGLKLSQSFENNLYTEEGGLALSLLWRHLMCHQARHWQQEGKPPCFSSQHAALP